MIVAEILNYRKERSDFKSTLDEFSTDTTATFCE